MDDSFLDYSDYEPDDDTSTAQEQFEAFRGYLDAGVVTDPDAQEEALQFYRADLVAEKARIDAKFADINSAIKYRVALTKAEKTRQELRNFKTAGRVFKTLMGVAKLRGIHAKLQKSRNEANARVAALTAAGELKADDLVAEWHAGGSRDADRHQRACKLRTSVVLKKKKPPGRLTRGKSVFDGPVEAMQLEAERNIVDAMDE